MIAGSLSQAAPSSPSSIEPIEPGAVRDALERVLSRPEFQHERHPLSDWLARKMGDFASWISRFFDVSPEAAGRVVAWMIYVALATVAALVIVWLVRTTMRSLRRAGPRDEARSASNDVRAAQAAELERRAREAEQRGDFALALRLYFWALVVGLGERGGLEYRDAWTNRELLERGAPAPEVERVLRPLVPELDRKTFGRAAAGPEDVALLSKLCREMLGAKA